MKSGANFSDQNLIKRLAKQGRSVEEISRVTHIQESAVDSFVSKAKGKKTFGPTKRPANPKPAE